MKELFWYGATAAVIGVAVYVIASITRDNKGHDIVVNQKDVYNRKKVNYTDVEHTSADNDDADCDETIRCGSEAYGSWPTTVYDDESEPECVDSTIDEETVEPVTEAESDTNDVVEENNIVVEDDVIGIDDVPSDYDGKVLIPMDDIRSYESDIENLDKEVDKLTHKLKTAKKRIYEVEKENESKREENLALAQYIQKCHREMEGYKKELSDVKKKLSEASFEDEAEEHKKRIQELEKELEEVKKHEEEAGETTEESDEDDTLTIYPNRVILKGIDRDTVIDIPEPLEVYTWDEDENEYDVFLENIPELDEIIRPSIVDQMLAGNILGRTNPEYEMEMLSPSVFTVTLSWIDEKTMIVKSCLSRILYNMFSIQEDEKEFYYYTSDVDINRIYRTEKGTRKGVSVNVGYYDSDSVQSTEVASDETDKELEPVTEVAGTVIGFDDDDPDDPKEEFLKVMVDTHDIHVDKLMNIADSIYVSKKRWDYFAYMLQMYAEKHPTEAIGIIEQINHMIDSYTDANKKDVEDGINNIMTDFKLKHHKEVK